MKYHNILHDNMLNGPGLRVVIFVSGCDRHCKGCQNPETWDKESGLTFSVEECVEVLAALEEDHCAGLTLVGGEPLMPYNVEFLTELCKTVKEDYVGKTVWCYTGFKYEEVKHLPIMEYIDVLLDGEFIQELADENVPWVGSTNQRVIDVQASRESENIVLYEG